MDRNLRILLFISILLTTAFCGFGQTLRGVVSDAETSKPLSPATVVNLTTQQTVTTDADGRFYITARVGDAISFSYIGYHSIQQPATTSTEMDVALLPLNVQLKEYILHPNYTPYQKDSVEMATLYSKELNTQRIKPKVDLNNGLEVSGLIGSAVQKISRSYKKNKKFKETFRKDEEQKFIDTRYRPSVVADVTGFSGDTLILFMNSYPMEYAFARAATDLELKMWIRDNYKDYLHRKNSGN